MKVMVNSIPKGGTHLLLKLVSLLGIADDPKRFWLGAGVIRNGFEPVNKLYKGGYNKDRLTIGIEVPVQLGSAWLSRRIRRIPDDHSFGAHCLYSKDLSDLLQANDVVPVTIIRDPRSIAASHMHYVKSWKGHFFHDHYMRLPSDYERLRFSIEGGAIGKYRLVPLRERYLSFMKWMRDPTATCIKFEDLAGVAGGGSESKQLAAIRSVANHIKVKLDDKQFERIASSLHGGKNTTTQSSTYRVGKIDGWKSELDSSLIELIEVELGDLLKLLDYAP